MTSYFRLGAGIAITTDSIVALFPPMSAVVAECIWSVGSHIEFGGEASCVVELGVSHNKERQ